MTAGVATPLLPLLLLLASLGGGVRAQSTISGEEFKERAQAGDPAMAGLLSNLQVKWGVTHQPPGCASAGTRKVEPGDTVWLRFIVRTGGRADGHVCDSSAVRDWPFYAVAGSAEQTGIVGLNAPLKGCCVGEKREALVPPYLGYQERVIEAWPDAKHTDGSAFVALKGQTTLLVEFEVAGIYPEGQMPEGAISNWFTAIDSDGDRKISKKELYFFFGSRLVMPNQLMPQRPPKKELKKAAKELFDKEDIDSSGHLSWEEFSGPKGAEDDPPVDWVALRKAAAADKRYEFQRPAKPMTRKELDEQTAQDKGEAPNLKEPEGGKKQAQVDTEEVGLEEEENDDDDDEAAFMKRASKQGKEDL